MKLSILIPSIPSRSQMLSNLMRELEKQIKGNFSSDEVEVLCLVDNKSMSIGKKRDTLKNISRGEYFTFLDDDDYPLDGYILKIISAIQSKSDVITFKQEAIISGVKAEVTFGLNNENEELEFTDQTKTAFKPIKRKPFPCCVWKSELAKDIEFPDVGYGEDWAWSEKVLERCSDSYHINAILHRYIYDEAISEAPTQSNEVWNNPNE